MWSEYVGGGEVWLSKGIIVSLVFLSLYGKHTKLWVIMFYIHRSLRKQSATSGHWQFVFPAGQIQYSSFILHSIPGMQATDWKWYFCLSIVRIKKQMKYKERRKVGESVYLPHMMWEGEDEAVEEDEELEPAEELVMAREPGLAKEAGLESYNHILGNQSQRLCLWVLQYLSGSHKHCRVDNLLRKCTGGNHFSGLFCTVYNWSDTKPQDILELLEAMISLKEKEHTQTLVVTM